MGTSTFKACGAIFLTVLSACDEMAPLPTAVSIQSETGVNQVARSPHERNPAYSPYFCIAGRRTDGKGRAFEYGARRIRFSSADLATDGSSIVYVVRSYDAGRTLSATARCNIPNSLAAKYRIGAVFHVTPETAPSPAGARFDIASVTEIDGMVVDACRYGGEYPDCNYEPAWLGMTEIQCSALDPYCGSGGTTDPGSGWSWGGGTGDDPLPPSPEETDRPECARNAQGNCLLRSLSAAEWSRIGELVRRMTEASEYCRGAKAIAGEMYGQGIAGGRIKVWDNQDRFINNDGQEDMRWGTNLSDAAGRILAYDSYLLFNKRSLFAHEALHAYLHSINSPLMGDSNEAWVRAHEGECAG